MFWKTLEVIGVVGGVLAIMIVIVGVGGAILYAYLTANGKNPFM